MYQAKSAENQVQWGSLFNTMPDRQCEVSFCSKKNAYQYYVTSDVSLTDLSHISFPAKSCEISLLIILNNTQVSLKP